MADIYSAECLEGFCSQCDVPSCACLHHLEDEEHDTDRDYDEEEEDFDDEDFDDQLDEDCGMTRDGSCTMIGTEFCDWMCVGILDRYDLPVLPARRAATL